jgi:hypothetical protein
LEKGDEHHRKKTKNVRIVTELINVPRYAAREGANIHLKSKENHPLSEI